MWNGCIGARMLTPADWLSPSALLFIHLPHSCVSLVHWTVFEQGFNDFWQTINMFCPRLEHDTWKTIREESSLTFHREGKFRGKQPCIRCYYSIWSYTERWHAPKLFLACICSETSIEWNKTIWENQTSPGVSFTGDKSQREKRTNLKLQTQYMTLPHQAA